MSTFFETVLVLGQGAGVLPEEDQVKEGQINVILSDSDPLKVFDGIPLKSWFKCDLKVEFLSEVVMGKIMKGGKVVLLLSGRWSSFKTTRCPMLIILCDKVTPISEPF